MTVSRRLPLLLAAPIAACTLLLTACGSDDTTAVSTTDNAPTETGATTAGLTSCPTAPPAADAQPQWSNSGTTGRASVVAATDTSAPKITVTTPFSVTNTQVYTLTEGTGPTVPATATVKVCYEGVNGRTGSVFDSSYQTGQPADFPLDGVIPGFSKAIAGKKVGSNIAAVIAPADGYTTGMPAAGIDAGDTLVFEIKILSAS